MIKKLTIISLMFFICACSKPSDLEMIYNPIKGFETGVWQMAIIVEAQTGFSSLIYDKTEADFESFSVTSVDMIPIGSSFYIFPVVKKNDYNQFKYDDSHCLVVSNYIKINKLGTVVDNPSYADYFIVVDVDESQASYYGTNTSNISITVYDTDENPYFHTEAKVISKSDKNFYYWPSKGAKPATYLTLKGFERIFKEAMPQAFS